MVRVTNEVLLERMDNIKEDIGDVKEHLKTLNGQTYKNTGFRIAQQARNKVVWGVFGIFGLAFATAVWKILSI